MRLLAAAAFALAILLPSAQAFADDAPAPAAAPPSVEASAAAPAPAAPHEYVEQVLPAAPASSLDAAPARRGTSWARRNWWAPALISLGATVFFDALGVAGAHSNSAVVDTAGGVSILIGTAATTAGWFVMADDDEGGWPRGRRITAGAVSGGARLLVLASGWGVSAVQVMNGWSTCNNSDAEYYCTAADDKNKADAQARGARTFWITTDIAFAMSGADIIGQFVYGYLYRETVKEPLTRITPTMLPTGNGMGPAIAWSGKF